ncbi:MAG: DUF4405 domain-containing protein [Candidatus Aenigmarchaeota archaeon]|nr:DUF4405 domain-containing protein [Candidatus Aenigmarchaeota archaeon]
MEKSRFLYIVDIGLIISFFFIFTTGLIKFPGLVQKLGIRHSSLPIYEINLLHDWMGIVMSLLVLIHLVLHWKWLVVMTKGLVKK